MKLQSHHLNETRQGLHKMVKFKSVADLQKAFPTEQKCIKHLERIIWKGIIISPFDPTSKVYRCKKRKNWYKCKNTNKYFNVKTGTVFDNTKLPLWIWFWALSIFSSHKKGNPSHQLARDVGITQKSAWFLSQRLRRAFDCPSFKTILEGSVEIDETFIGGSNSNRHWDKKAPKTQGRNWKDKIPVWGGIGNGILIAQVVPNTKKETLEPIIRKYIKEGSSVHTDEWLAYNGLGEWFNHQIVIHKLKQYVNGKITTNRIENAWSHLKRLINTYHWISRKHAQKYVDEFTFRYNTRNYSEQERFDLLLFSTIGKKMTYRELIAS